MAIFIPLPGRAPYRPTTAPPQLQEGRVFARSVFSAALPLQQLPEYLAAQQIECIWLPYSRAQLIQADLESLLPLSLTSDLIPVPLDLWLADYAFKWDAEASEDSVEALHAALSCIDDALALRPGQSLRSSVLQRLPTGATTPLPIRAGDIGPIPEPPARADSARPFAPVYAPARLSTPIPIGPWTPAALSQTPADHVRLVQVLGVNWNGGSTIGQSILQRYRPGRWYADPEYQVLARSAQLQLGAAYQSPAMLVPWASASAASATLGQWTWTGSDLLDPVATTVASAIWSVLSADSSAAGEWWRSADRAARLQASIQSQGRCEPASASRLSFHSAGPTGAREALMLGWLPSARSLEGVPAATRRHWAATLATHPSSGITHYAAAHSLVTQHAPEDPAVP